MRRKLARLLPAHGCSFRTLTGKMTQKQRARALRDFQEDPPTTVFLLSVRAGAGKKTVRIPSDQPFIVMRSINVCFDQIHVVL